MYIHTKEYFELRGALSARVVPHLSPKSHDPARRAGALPRKQAKMEKSGPRPALSVVRV
jgi:hypothetical protein